MRLLDAHPESFPVQNIQVLAHGCGSLIQHPDSLLEDTYPLLEPRPPHLDPVPGCYGNPGSNAADQG